MKYTHWRLKAGSDRRFRSGHPWVYSNELAESPKGLEPGAPVELSDAGGKFLARGYGNPKSLISFRTLTRDPDELDPLSSDRIAERLAQAHRLRFVTGLGDVSHRLCFGEADALPGLVIDRYRTASGQVFVVQAHSAGMDQVMSRIDEILKIYVEKIRGVSWAQTSIVLRNDLGVRKLEGLEEREPQVLRQAAGAGELGQSSIRIAAALGKDNLEFQVNLVSGQKTGFFLDQRGNIELAALRFANLKGVEAGRIRILDLCTYVGQWGAQLARVFRAQSQKVQVVAVDASANALELAALNIRAQGAECETLKADVLKDLGSLKDGSFDLVVSDPPALIQGRKDIPQGTHAYLQLNTQAMRLVAPMGGLVSCSCSGLFEEEEFLRTLAKAAHRNRRSVRWIGRGAPAPDHPMLAEFPEGRYLKGWMGVL